MGGRALRGGLAALSLVGCASLAQAETKREAKVEESPPVTREAVESAALAAPGMRPEKPRGEAKRPDPALVKVQIMLDRAHFSPGAIDGRDGENLRKALAAFATANGLTSGGELKPQLADKLQSTSAEPVLTAYTVSAADAAGPFVDKIPAKMEDQADLEALGYTSPREMLAERFHMAPDLLDALNPDKDFGRSGTEIVVAAVPALDTGKPKPVGKETGKDSGKDDARNAKDVARIEVDKESRSVRAFDASGRLVAFYPASIGSEEKPAPSGKAKVEGVAYVPTYTYNPEYDFAGVKAKTKFTIPPGPNNPVGIVWIDLSIPSYGIHGTPEPEKVGKTESHGCVRLTNWDARDLATRVARGAEVDFKDD